jgi:hypothetical protein
MTLNVGSGVTPSGTTTIAAGSARFYLIIVTSATEYASKFSDFMKAA